MMFVSFPMPGVMSKETSSRKGVAYPQVVQEKAGQVGTSTKSNKIKTDKSRQVRPGVNDAPSKNAPKRKPSSSTGQVTIKRRRSSEGEAKALLEFGHLVDQTPKKYIPHSKGTEAIPGAPDADSEFEDEIFLHEDRGSIWQTYKKLALKILSESQLSDKEKDRCRVLAFDICREEDIPMVCPVGLCPRSKPMYSRIGFLRHVVEKHLPQRPLWRCPYQGGQCSGVQPRRVAHVRHVGWVHARNYALAAALTFREDLQFLQENDIFDPKFVINGPKTEHFYAQVGEIPPQVAERKREFRRAVFSSSSSPSSSSEDELDQSTCCEIIEEVASLEVGEIDKSAPAKKNAPPGATAPPSTSDTSKAPQDVPSQATKESPSTCSLKHPDSHKDPPTDPGILPVSDSGIPAPSELENEGLREETVVATSHLVNLLAGMDKVEEEKSCENPKQRIPGPFLFETDAKFIDPSVGEVNSMIRGLQELQVTHVRQDSIHQSLLNSLKELKIAVDEHEGSLKLTSDQLQESVDLKRKLYKSQQQVTTLEESRARLEKDKSASTREIEAKDRSIKLLEDHVRTLQADVKRLTADNLLAVTTVEELQGRVKKLEAYHSFGSKVALLLQEDGLLE